MYLSDILFENLGPVEKLDLQLQFASDETPMPAIFVGANGSGKTVLLSTIADALILMATPHFQDIVPQQGLGHAYFKILGATNQRMHTTHALALLGFKHSTKYPVYVEKTGNLSTSKISQLSPRFNGATWPQEGNSKTFSGLEKNEVQTICRNSALCFFTSSRRELPHWLNAATVGERPDNAPRLEEDSKFSNVLGKPVFIERCSEENKRWILDVLFDSRTEIIQDGDEVKTTPYEYLGDRLKLTVARNNINQLLQTILNDSEIRIHANYRSRGPRLAVAKGPKVIIPSLDNLSLGQSLLFNLFCTIARYADRYDLEKGHQLDQIEGIVVIDEIDAHLHTELQFGSLPKLIKLFPRVQFIITTHAPMFLLGMEKEFGADSISIFEMPKGDQISTERFSEFRTSIAYYKQTKAFEDEIRDRMLAATKPIVLLEGETDRDYLIAYLNLLSRNDLLSSVDIDWAGNSVNGVAQNGGNGTLETIAKAFRAKLALLQTKLLLVHDCDGNKPNETLSEKLYVRGIPHNPSNTKFRRGIENLLPESLARQEFYDLKTDDKYGGQIQKLNKRRLCDWVIAQRDIELFSDFRPLITFLEEIVLPVDPA